MRNLEFDIGKFVVMLFVVYGHIPHLFDTVTNVGFSYFSNINIAIAMPFFFIVSGYFSASSIQSKVVARIFSLLWPLFSFGIVIGFFRFMSGEVPFGKMLLVPFHNVIFGGWFLRALAAVFLIHACVWRFVSERFRCVALLIIYILLFFSPPISFLFTSSQVMHMFPYFTFGMVALQKWKWHENKWIVIPAGIMFVSVVLFGGNIRTNGMGFYWVSSDWRTVVSDGHSILCFFGRTFVGICGTISFLWCLKKIMMLFPKVECLATFGTTTLGVYLLHEWPLQLIGRHYHIHPFSTSASIGLAILLFVVCHYLVLLINHINVLRIFFFGDPDRIQGMVDNVLHQSQYLFRR